MNRLSDRLSDRLLVRPGDKLISGGILLLLLSSLSCVSSTPERPRTGLQVLVDEGFARLRGKRIALVTNPTGVTRDLRSLIDLLHEAEGVELVSVLGPEHGARGAAEAGVAVDDSVDPRTGVPMFSLYGAVKKPTEAMLRGADAIVFDIQDIGVRTYTYLSTLRAVLETAAELDREVWVLDRPVPIGADRAGGPVLEAPFESFVGCHPVALRHGLTAGEFAQLVNVERKIGARLEVVRLEGYRRSTPFESFDLPWVAPSPNIPDQQTALVYAGTVLIEGAVTVSEGRGTTRPFRLLGAPWVDAPRLVDALREVSLPGVLFREAYFTPSFSKHEGALCAGVEIHVLDPARFLPVETAVAVLIALRRLHPDELRIEARRFDILAGSSSLREGILAGRTLEDLTASWQPALGDYLRRRQAALLYEE